MLIAEAQHTAKLVLVTSLFLLAARASGQAAPPAAEAQPARSVAPKSDAAPQSNQLPKDCHFAAWEQPELLVGELRTSFRTLR